MRTLIESIIGKKGVHIGPEDLKMGFVVKFRDGNYYVALPNKILPRNGRLCRSKQNMLFKPWISDYDEFLHSRRSREYDIIEVWGYDNDRLEDEYTEYFRYYDDCNKDNTFGQEALKEFIRKEKLKRMK